MQQIKSLAGIPDDHMLRVSDLVRSESNPRAILPFGRSTLFDKVATGRFPEPVRLSQRLIVWRADTIRAYLAGKVAK